MQTLKEQLLAYVGEHYGAAPEYLWARFPLYAALRHADNQKWFALLLTLPQNRLGLPGEDAVDIVNVKVADPLLADFLTQQEGYFRGYHFGRGNWVSILLNGRVPWEEIQARLDESYLVTASKETRQKQRPPKDWLIPANPRYYDVEAAFQKADEINWKQAKGAKAGDVVYLYLGAPVSAILYCCMVTETDIPFHFQSDGVRMTHVMKMKRLKQYHPDRFSLAVLRREYGVYSVRGPRGVPELLSKALEKEGVSE